MKNYTKTFMAILGLALLLNANTAQAKDTYYINFAPGIGIRNEKFSVLGNDVSADYAGFGFQIAAGGYASDYLRAELMFGYNIFSADEVKINGVPVKIPDIKVEEAMLMVNSYFLPLGSSNFEPFIGFGLGVVSVVKDNSFGWNFSFGFNGYLRDGLALGLSYRLIAGTNPDEVLIHQFTFPITLSF